MAFTVVILVFVVYCQLAYSQLGPRCSFTQAPRFCSSLDFYRTIDGSCNNKKNPTWGQSLRPHTRLLRPVYGKQEGLRAKSVTGNDLPSPRRITTAILSTADESSLSNKITNMVWVFGQFVDHDITLTPQTEMKPCCEGSSSEDCIPISIPVDDPFWSSRGRTCMNLVRSTGVRKGDCGVRHREQLNALTPMIDASNVYGSTVEQAMSLREMKDGLMKTEGNDLPLEVPSLECDIPSTESDRRCFAAGDMRATEWHGLTSVHTIFVRLHNKIAERLGGQIDQLFTTDKIKDEIIYQETRRIIAAILQIITYRDFLPIVLGNSNMEYFNMNYGTSYRYRPNIRPVALNAFSTAASRFGHSLVTDQTTPRNRGYDALPPIVLRNSFFQPSAYREAGCSHTMRGLATEPANIADKHFSQEIRDRLFEKSLSEGGGDLPAFNIQRGRDHGLPSYNEFRKFCKLDLVTSSADGSFNMPDHKDDMTGRFSQVYDHVDDIDLFPAGVTEKPIPGGLVGPTFACIIGEQFKRLRDGDRFWHENPFVKHPFTPSQLSQLRKVTLSKIICNITDSEQVPNNPFYLHSPMVDCEDNHLPEFRNWLTNLQQDRLQLLLQMKTFRQLHSTAPSFSVKPNLFVFGRLKISRL